MIAHTKSKVISFNKVVILTDAQYAQLVSEGQIVIGDKVILYDNSYVYLTPDPIATDEQSGWMSAEDKSKLDSLDPTSVPVNDVKVNDVSVVTAGVANVTVPTKTSELTNDSDFIKTDQLSTIEQLRLNSVYSLMNVSSIAGTSSANPRRSARWYVNNVCGITTPYDGMKIAVKIPIPGDGYAGLVLSINGNNDEDYHPVLYNNQTITSHYPADTVKYFVYDAEGVSLVYLEDNVRVSITGVWKADANYFTYTNSWRPININGTAWKNNNPNSNLVNLVSGNNITFTTNGNDLTISSSSSGTISDVEVNGTSVVTDGVAEINLADVATSGSYEDLEDTPTIPKIILVELG